jgi:major type 1 subunit fimbrin (pilin)
MPAREVTRHSPLFFEISGKPEAYRKGCGKAAAINPQSAIRNPQSAIRNPQSAIRNPGTLELPPPLSNLLGAEGPDSIQPETEHDPILLPHANVVGVVLRRYRTTIPAISNR